LFHNFAIVPCESYFCEKYSKGTLQLYDLFSVLEVQCRFTCVSLLWFYLLSLVKTAAGNWRRHLSSHIISTSI